MKQLITGTLAVLIAASALFAIRVSPGSFSTQNAPLGHVQNLGISLVCNADNAKFVLLSVIPPDAENMPHCVGYRPIPDVDWFILDGDSLPTDSAGFARSRMAIDIPDSPDLYNQHFIIRVFVTATGSGMFQPAIIPYYFIETPPLENPSVPPDGKLAVAPSIIEMDMIKSRGEFILYNNDERKHKYTLQQRIPPRSSRRFPNLSPAFSAITDSSAVNISPDTVEIIPGGRISISVGWMNAAAVSTPTEAIILITDDEGTTNFVRVKLNLVKE